MVHSDEDVAAPGELDQFLAHTAAVAGITNHAVIAIKAEGEAFELRLHMRCVAHGDLPAVAFDPVSSAHLLYERIGTFARWLSATLLKNEDAGFMFDARTDVGTVDAILAE